jgi:phosphatidate cytidylyltransferase
MRLLFGWLLFGLAMASILAGGLPFALALGTASYMAGNEFIAMAKVKGMNPSARIVRAMIIAFFVIALLPAIPGLKLSPDFSLEHFPLLITVGLCASFFRLLFRRHDSDSPPATIADIATTILGFIYVGYLPSHLVLLRNLCPENLEAARNPLMQAGLAYVWASLFIIWSTDVAAYYVGKKFGKHLLYPEISPKKTYEGAIGGFIAGVLMATCVVYSADHYVFACHPFLFKLWQAPLMGAVVSIAGQLGDLCESLLKRDAGIKDSGATIPGHGGFLDRGDSIIFGGAVSYYWISLVVLGNW